MIGAVLGAVLITRFDGHQLKPFISAYLLLMGLYILSKAYRHVIKRRAPRHVAAGTLRRLRRCRRRRRLGPGGHQQPDRLG